MAVDKVAKALTAEVNKEAEKAANITPAKADAIIAKGKAAETVAEIEAKANAADKAAKARAEEDKAYADELEAVAKVEAAQVEAAQVEAAKKAHEKAKAIKAAAAAEKEEADLARKAKATEKAFAERITAVELEASQVEVDAILPPGTRDMAYFTKYLLPELQTIAVIDRAHVQGINAKFDVAKASQVPPEKWDALLLAVREVAATLLI